MPNPLGKFFKKEHLRNHLLGSIEIGYTQYGPTIGLSGTLTTVEKVVFINNITILVKRLSDGATSQFNWFAFRPHRFSANRDLGVELKMPSKFLVSPATPYAYNILFSDQNQYSAMNPTIKMIKNRWEETLEKFCQSPGNFDIFKVFENFLKEERMANYYSQLVDFCYWEEGAHAISILFISKENQPLLEMQKSFTLSVKDVQDLRRNAGMIIADICKQMDITYSLVQAPLKDYP